MSGMTVDGLAAEIRRVDGNHNLGAGALAEALMPYIEAALSGTREAVEPVAWPIGCLRPNSCSRHRSCMYANCQHEDRDITAEIDAAAPPSDPVGQGAVTVPQAAIDWLMGAGPDEDGHYFGDSPKDEIRGAFWWRSRFRSMIALSPAPEAGSDEVERLRAERDSLLKSHRLLNVSGAKLQDRAEAAEARETALCDQLGKMRKALTFYADPENYRPRDPYPSHIEKDNRGDRARTAMVTDTLSRATLAETQEAGR